MSADRIAELEHQLATQKRRADEEKRRADEGNRRADEEKRRADEEKQLRLREAEARKDAEAFNAHIRRELAGLQHEVTEREFFSHAYFLPLVFLHRYLTQQVQKSNSTSLLRSSRKPTSAPEPPAASPSKANPSIDTH